MFRKSMLFVVFCAGLALPALADEAIRVLQPTDRQLRLELGASWNEADLTRLAVRSKGRQHSPELPSSPHLDIALDGCSLILVDLGPRATKVVACPRSAGVEARLAAAETMTAKAGSRIEIRPLRSPTLLAPGTHLPVRVYFDNAAQTGARVVARGPGGKDQVLRTDNVGAAHVAIDESGSWTVLYSTREHTAELRFEVPAKTLWDAAPPLVPSRATKKAAATGWKELGPAPLVDGDSRNTGRASSIAVSRDRRNRYYVGGASGGVWESVDGGRAWTPLNGQLPLLSIGALAVDPSNDKVIYAGSGEANYAYHSLYGLGLYRTFNRGRRWRILAPELFSGRAFSRLVVSPHDSRVVWAAVGPAGGTFEGTEGAREHPERDGAMGLFRSRDRGVTWKHLRAAQGLPAFAASDIDLDPIDANRVYAAFGDAFGKNRNGVYRSTDGGETFEPVLTRQSTGLPFGRVTLALAPSDPDRLYAMVTNPSLRVNLGGFLPSGASAGVLFRSDDGGSTWTSFTTGNFMGQQGQYNSTVIVAPDDPDTVFLGGIQMIRSTNGGASFTDVTPPHVDHHDTVFDAIGRLVVANDGGVNRSRDLGATWETRNEGLGIVQIYAGLSLHPTNPDVVLAGMQDNGTNLRRSDTLDWISVFGGDGGYTAINPDDPSLMFVEFQGTGNLYRSTNGGLLFNLSAAGIDGNDRACFLPPMVFDPTDSNRMLYATHRIYESTDGGRNWQAISDDLTSGSPWAVRSLVIAPSNSNIVYAMTNDGRVLVSFNGGVVWDLVLEDIGGWPRVTRQIAVDPTHPSQAYVADMGFGGPKVLATRSRGRTWQEIGGGLPDVPVNTVAVHREGNRRLIFAGTDAGVFFSRNFGRTWEELGNLPNTPVNDLVVDVNHDRLVASTLGRGAWSIGLP